MAVLRPVDTLVEAVAGHDLEKQENSAELTGTPGRLRRAEGFLVEFKNLDKRSVEQ